MSHLVGIVVWSASAWYVGAQVLRAWSRGTYAAPDRLVLISSTVDAVVILAVVRAVVPPPGLLSWAWVAATAAVGAGIAGAVLRWPALGWAVPDTDGRPARRVRNPRRRAFLGAAYAGVGLCLVVVLA
ncbi:hypothetical protein ACQPWY_32765 [Pseudonocardia xinjiangensis]|uniref:hypothetical protein n=1 Tax=Pseudonocardia xinjiangensis TaxID=75289 RepID=UPI003D8DB076